MYCAIFSDRGDLLGEWATEAEAVAVLDDVIADDPSATEELAVFGFTDEGQRVGEPIPRGAPAGHDSR